MKRLLLLLFFPLAVFGQTSSTGSAVNGSFANRPVCSRNVSDSNAHNGDVFSDTDDGSVYKCLGGAWWTATRGTTSPAISSKLAAFDPDLIDAGSSAYFDIRAYGAYELFSSTICNTTNGSPRVRLGAASNFKNGEYATCYNAGAAATVSTPSAPTVTPSDHAGGMTVVHDSGGATSYAYCVRAEDKLNGLSACSTAGSTSTGAASLGQTTQFNLSGCTRSNNAVTCTSTTAHSFVVGQLIILNNMADKSFNGNWITISPTSGTTITFLSGWDTRNGASTSTTPSTTRNVWGFKVNRVSYTTQANALRYHLYGPNCPDTCNWMGQSVLPYWDDYGATMMASQTQPTFIPTLATAPARNQHFTFKITGGGGTTTLTASANAGTTITSTIISDVGPSIAAAGVAANLFAHSGCVMIPLYQTGGSSSNWQINSYTELSGNNVCIQINGGVLVANNTIGNPSKIIGLGGGSAIGNFGTENAPIINGTGFPLIYGGVVVPTIRDMNITAGALNGALGIYLFSPATMIWKDIYLSTGSGGSNDCIGQQLVMRADAGGNSFSKAFTNISGITGTCPSNSPVPTIVDMSTGTGSSSGDTLTNGWFLNRTAYDNDLSGVCGSGFFVSMTGISGQNATAPLLQISGTCSNGLGGVIGGSLGEADFATPTVALYTYGGQKWNGTFSGSAGIPNGSGNALVGAPAASIITSGAPQTTVGNSNMVNSIIGTVPDGNNGGSSLSVQNQDFALGTGYVLFSEGPTGSAPTCSVATAGPPFTTAGTYYFSYAPVYPNGGLGSTSFPSVSSCSANGTTQQITINIPSTIPAATGYVFYRNSSSVSGGFQLQTVASGCGPATALSVVMYGASCGPGSYAVAGGGPAGIVNGNMWAQDLILGAALAPPGVTGGTHFYMDSTRLWPSFKPNGNRAYVIPGISGPVINGHNLCADGTSGAYVDCLTTQTIASGTTTLGTNEIAAKTCETVVTRAATGVVTTDAISYSFNAAPSGAYTSGLFVQSYVTPDNVNFLVCNPTTESLRPPGASLNWRVTR